MSDSRLEKFIYAICSMDVSDLPVPLSRIETLWNCLITGETPDFEPLSRNEKYLMAMLDRYDISNLPAPMSRGEKLLYKIAVGETDLSDVPGYLSRYEELLKYLIENGENSEDDFEYVLYTLNQSLNTLYLTAEKPVKSAILKGQTLVNLVKNKAKATLYSDGGSTYTEYYLTQTVKPNSRYLVIVNCSNNTSSVGEETRSIFLTQNAFATNNWLIKKPIDCNGVLKTVITTIDTPEVTLKIGISSGFGGSVDVSDVMLIEYQDGMENWDIPYFEGMQSVKMPVLCTTGKNLFDGVSYIDGYIFPSGSSTTTDIKRDSNVTSILFNVDKNTDYILSTKTSFDRGWVAGSLEPIKIESKVAVLDYNKVSNTIKFNSGEFTHILVYLNSTKIDIEEIQVEKGTVATQYEPYKSITLSTPSDLELRGIGEVKDTLDCLTGEVTERIGEIVFSSSDGFDYLSNQDDGNFSSFAFIKDINRTSGYNGEICDRLKRLTNYLANENGIYYYGNDGRLELRLDTTNFISRDLNGLNDYLSKNPITVQYFLATPTIKTVDLTVVDQDNQPTQLGTFENVTHVSLEAENLIPEVEMEVATRISTELASASPLMDDISTKQEQLNTTVDEQSENVDATMIATTEIFEETL